MFEQEGKRGEGGGEAPPASIVLIDGRGESFVGELKVECECFISHAVGLELMRLRW